MAEVDTTRKETYRVDEINLDLKSNQGPLKPSADKTIDSPNVYVLFGATHSRKRSLALKLQYQHPSVFRRAVPHTTRRVRPLEVPGVDYNFVSRNEFLEMIQEKKFLEYIYIGESEVFKISPDSDQIPNEGELFGTSLDSFSKSSLTDTPVLLLTLHSLSADHLRNQNFKASYINLSLSKSDSQSKNDFPFVSTFDADLAYDKLKSIMMPDLRVGDSETVMKTSESFQAARIEWENVENNLTDNAPKNPAKLSLVNSAQALEYFRSKRMLDYINRIRLPPETRGIRKIFKIIFGPPCLNSSLIHERNLILAMALHPFDNNDCFHTSILDSIYRLLTGSKASCPRYGSHWEDIGFQGSDPATDLRGAGMLGLVNIFDMVTSPIAFRFALDILKLSKDPVQFFPMCALSMNLTVMTLVYLRDGILVRICNRRGMVFSVVNDVYKAMFYRLYTVWKEQHKTIWDSDAVLSELEKYTRRNISRLLNDFYNALEQLKTRDDKALGIVKPDGDSKPVEFRSIDEIELELSLSTE